MFQELNRQLKFLPKTSSKCYLGEVEKAIFEGLARLFKHTFGELSSTKCGLVEVQKVMIHVVEFHFGLCLMRLDQPKMRLG